MQISPSTSNTPAPTPTKARATPSTSPKNHTRIADLSPFCYHPQRQRTKPRALKNNAPPPTPHRNPRRLRAPLLDRQHLRNFRAPFLLRRLLLARRLPPGKTQLLHRAD